MSVITDAIAGLVSSLGDQAVKVRTAISGVDPATAGKLQELAANLDAMKQQAQAASDAAQSGYWTATLGVTGSNWFRFFVAGPKPALFWVCVFAFGLQYVIQPIINWILGAAGASYHLAPIDMTLPTQLLIGGMGLTSVVVRGIEKINGAASNH